MLPCSLNHEPDVKISIQTIMKEVTTLGGGTPLYKPYRYVHPEV